MLSVIVGIGYGNVKLYGVLAGHGSGVGDFHVHSGGPGFQIHVHRLDLLLKSGIGEAVAEGIGHFVGIVPCAAGAAHFGIRAALVQDSIRVAGLIVLVAGIDAFRLDDGVVDIDGGIGIGPLQVAVVHGGGADGVVHCVGIGQMAAGADDAAQDVGHAVEAVAAGGPHLKDGVHSVILLQLVDLHGVAVIEKDDQLAAVFALGLRGCRDQVPLIVGQTQGVFLVQAVGGIHAGFAGGIVRVLGACAADGQDQDIVCCQGISPAAVRLVQIGNGRLLIGVDAAHGGSCQVEILHGAGPGCHFRLEDGLKGVAAVHAL